MLNLLNFLNFSPSLMRIIEFWNVVFDILQDGLKMKGILSDFPLSSRILPRCWRIPHGKRCGWNRFWSYFNQFNQIFDQLDLILTNLIEFLPKWPNFSQFNQIVTNFFTDFDQISVNLTNFWPTWPNFDQFQPIKPNILTNFDQSYTKMTKCQSI